MRLNTILVPLIFVMMIGVYYPGILSVRTWVTAHVPSFSSFASSPASFGD